MPFCSAASSGLFSIICVTALDSTGNPKMAASESKIIRFSVAERVVHWSVALAFLYAALTGLALWSPRLFWLAAIFGGGTTVSAWHPWSGSRFSLFFVLMFRAWQRLICLTAAALN